MKTTLITLAIFMGIALLSQGFVKQAFAGEIVKQKLSISVANAIAVLEQNIKGKGLEIFAKIDHQASAKKAELTMPPAIVLIFGNPKVGTELMNANMAWSYELPLKIAVYEDANGMVWAQTSRLSTDIPSPGQEKRMEAVNGLLTNLVNIQ